jgi:hypothetical protein
MSTADGRMPPPNSARRPAVPGAGNGRGWACRYERHRGTVAPGCHLIPSHTATKTSSGVVVAQVSTSTSTTAVWERLCGSIPMMTVIFSSSCWERSPEADKADAGQRAHTPLESRHGQTPASDSSKESQPGSGSRKESQPAGILRRYASKSRATRPHPTISREDRGRFRSVGGRRRLLVRRRRASETGDTSGPRALAAGPCWGCAIPPMSFR